MNKVVKNIARHDKRKWFKGIADRAEEAAKSNNNRELYLLTKRLPNKGQVEFGHIKDGTGNLLTANNEQLKRWEEYYSRIMRTLPAAQNASPGNHNNVNINKTKINTILPSLTEIKIAINQLNIGKAGRIDNLPAELIKLNRDLSAKVLESIIEEIETKS